MADFLKTLISLTVLFWAFSLVRGDPNESFVFQACNEVQYVSGDPFKHSLDYVLSDMETVTANHPGYDYYTESPYPDTVMAYGHASCNPALTYSDCVTCISYVKQAMLAACPSSIGAQMVLQDCRMRYEKYPFNDN